MAVNAVQTGTAVSAGAWTWIPLDIHQSPFNVSFGARFTSGGGATYRVEHTFDNVLRAGVSARPFTHPDVSAATTNRDGNYAAPVRAVRLFVVSVSASCNMDFTVYQASP